MQEEPVGSGIGFSFGQGMPSNWVIKYSLIVVVGENYRGYISIQWHIIMLEKRIGKIGQYE